MKHKQKHKRPFSRHDKKPQYGSAPAQQDKKPPHASGPARHDQKPRHASTSPRQDKKPQYASPPPRHDKKRQHAPAPARREKLPQREGIMLWGLHAVREAWLNPKRRCINLWLTESGIGALQKTLDEAQSLKLSRPAPKLIERAELDRMLPPGSVHQGIALDAAALPEPALHEIIDGDEPPDLVIALDQVTDPHNVGAIARSAAAFGAGAVIMTERNAPSLTGVLAKSASGAIEHVPLVHIVNLARAIEELQQAGYWCVGLAEEGQRDLGECDLSGRTALFLGAEGEGLRQLTRKKCDELARLPTGGAIGSLNVSNAAAIALYEVRRQKK